MSKTGKLRAYVKANPGAQQADICKATGLANDFVSTVCGQRVKRGEFTRDKDDGYTWNVDFELGKRGQNGKRSAGKKVLGNRAHLRAVRKAKRRTTRGGTRSPKLRSIADVARKHIAAPSDAPPVTLQTHVQTTLAVFGQVIDVGSMDAMAQAAWRSHCEAVKMMAAERMG